MRREGNLKNKEELEKEKEERERMKSRNKEEREKKKQKEREKKEKQKEKEKLERLKREERIKKEREEKERQKQLEKENKYKLKEEREKEKQKEREEREKLRKKEKEEREKEKQKLKEEKMAYNKRFQIVSAKLTRGNLGILSNKYNDTGKLSQNSYFVRQSYYSKKLYSKKRRHSHKKIQPKNRIPKVEPKKNLGKTALKVKPKRNDDEDESEAEPIDFEEKLMKFPRFRAKYGKNYVLKNKNKYSNLESYLTEKKMGATNRTNSTISEVDEEEKNNKNIKKGKLGKIKNKGKISMDKKMKQILGKHYKILLDDPLNPYGTCWPSNFLKAGYDTGFEYHDFQSGVPVLKLKSLGKKSLPPIKKKGMNFTNNTSIYSPNKNSKSQNMFPGTSGKKNFNTEFYEIKTNKSDNLTFIKDKMNNKNDEDNNKLNDIIEENENQI